MYGLLGTSSQVHIGPFALVSMMVSSSLSYINPDENFDDYLGAVTTLCFICGDNSFSTWSLLRRHCDATII